MGIGYLEVEVFTAGRALSVIGASVVIKHRNDGILMQLVTDGNGLTETVQLECPDVQNTFEPDDPGSDYAVYDVEITADGYQPSIIHDMHIFDTETSFLPVNMLPLLKEDLGANSDEVEETYIPEQAIEFSAPRYQQGAIAPPRIIGDVFIPNYITVHLGSPNYF